METDIEDLLRRYLEKEAEDPIRRRLEVITNWQLNHDKQDDSRHADIFRTLDGHNYRITGLEQKANEIKTEVEDTKNHNLDEIRKRNSMFRERETTVRDLIVKTLWGILILLAGVGIHAVITSVSQGKPIPSFNK